MEPGGAKASGRPAGAASAIGHGAFWLFLEQYLEQGRDTAHKNLFHRVDGGHVCESARQNAARLI